MSNTNRFQIKLIVIVFFTVLSFLTSNTSNAQEVNSPLSFIGLGDQNSGATVNNVMMGGLGVANANGIYANVNNPALLARNRYVVFEVGANGTFKSIQDRNQRQSTFGGNYNSLTLALPLSSKWTMALGLLPYTSVDYEIVAARNLDLAATTSFIKDEAGSGGINKAIFSNGYRVTKDLYLGLETAFMFGSINRNSSTQIVNPFVGNVVKLEDRTTYSSIAFKAGAAWRKKLKKDMFVNVGATIDLTQNINATKLKRYGIYESTGTSIFNADTLNNLVPSKEALPTTSRIGISLEKLSKWAVSADFSYTKGNTYQSLDKTITLHDSYKVAVGGEYTPEFNSVSSYFKRVQYRLGASYSSTPYDYLNNGNKAKDMNLSCGVSLPLRNLSYLNIAYVIGKRGLLADNGFEEQYSKIVIGLTLSDAWFRKFKID